jgi:Uma2 family endonuclease
MAQLRRYFWEIPAERMILDPPPGTATEKHLLRLASERGYPSELLDGVLIDRMPGFQSALVIGNLLRRLMNWLEDCDSGIVIGGGKCPVRLRPGTVRLAGIYFVSWKQMPGGTIPNDPISDLVPDLVVDILSQWGTRSELDRKRDDFLAAGTRWFWLLDKDERTVEISTCQRTRIYEAEGIVVGEGVVPGFAMPVAEIFQLPFRPRGQKES